MEKWFSVLSGVGDNHAVCNVSLGGACSGDPDRRFFHDCCRRRTSGSLIGIHAREWAGIVLLVATIAAMLLACRWEFPAALVSLISLAAFAAIVHMRRAAVLVIAAIPNFLFLLDWKLRRYSARSSKNK